MTIGWVDETGLIFSIVDFSLVAIITIREVKCSRYNSETGVVKHYLLYPIKPIVQNAPTTLFHCVVAPITLTF